MRAFWDLNRQFSGVNDDPDDAWRAAALRAAQQLRACGSGAAPPAAPVPAPALDSFGEVLEKSLEERKVIALEAIAGAARLWVVSVIKINRCNATTNSMFSSSFSKAKTMKGRMRTIEKGHKA